ncbi:hypothetical protein [Pseudonocardia sp. HH130630-07]|uniref:hypothetical protein n=1 Tax=Pseudonocardia sp. HH130630-07 TaxID=1690815 RepID=UPI0012EA8C70|nr:hypothetical protein [Pseudonocardia sp. HH130630-07]
MDKIVKMTGGVEVGTALPCAPTTVVPHEVAHPTLTASPMSGLRRWDEAQLIAPVTLATGGDVYPKGWAAEKAVLNVDVHKFTGAFVPERRGGT